MKLGREIAMKSKVRKIIRMSGGEKFAQMNYYGGTEIIMAPQLNLNNSRIMWN